MLAVTVGLLVTLGLALVVMLLVALPNLVADTRVPALAAERALDRVRRRARWKPAAIAHRIRWTAVRSGQAVGRAGVAVGRPWVAGGSGRVAVGRGWEASVRGWRWLVRVSIVLYQRVSEGWAPVSAALHELLDRLESHGQPSLAAAELSRPAAGPDSQQRSLGGTYAEKVAPVTVSAADPVVTPAPAQVAKARGPVQERFDVAAVMAGRSVGRPRSFPAISGPIPEIRDPAHSSSTASSQPDVPANDVPTDAAQTDADTVIDLRQSTSGQPELRR